MQCVLDAALPPPQVPQKFHCYRLGKKYLRMQGAEVLVDQYSSGFLPKVESSGDQGLRTNTSEWLHNHLHCALDESQHRASPDRMQPRCRPQIQFSKP